ncbi:hypothetical protein D9M68_557710 [compost metagenome]
MKKVFLSASALILATAFSFAGTPETKAETKAKPEVRTETAKVYHYVSKNGDGSINFAEGEPTSPTACQGLQQIPCRWTSEDELTSPMQPTDIENEASVTARRPNN